MGQLNILLLGSGGREHALAWKLSKSPICGHLYIGPGNAGTAGCGENVAVDPSDFASIGRFCKVKGIDILVVGPEAPLVDGIADHFIADDSLRNIYVVGPSARGALLEGSKAFAKEFMMKYGIPTASYREYDQSALDEGRAYIKSHSLPVVLKADGLAAGKGVLICEDRDEAVREFEAMLGGKFGEAGTKVVIEQFLSGIEFSVFVLTDGSDYKLLPIAKDYKRIGEGDTGLNTGGMGSVSPVPFVDDGMMRKVTERIIEPTIKGIKEENIRYHGFIFFGLISVNGDPYVIEYNCRMGDPETQSVMPRLESDLVEMLIAMRDGRLKAFETKFDPRFVVSTVCVSGGYPGSYAKGKQISLPDIPGSTLLFHAGTKTDDGKLLTSGGRVLAATAYGRTLEQALQLSRNLAAEIDFEGKYFRRDIGFDL